MNEKPAFHSFKDRVYYMKKGKDRVDCGGKYCLVGAPEGHSKGYYTSIPSVPATINTSPPASFFPSFS